MTLGGMCHTVLVTYNDVQLAGPFLPRPIWACTALRYHNKCFHSEQVELNMLNSTT